jgi:hypothetical protein
MRDKPENLNDIPGSEDEQFDEILSKMVRWTENGMVHRGTVTGIFFRQGIKYLIVMTIFGQRRTVKETKVKLLDLYNPVF